MDDRLCSGPIPSKIASGETLSTAGLGAPILKACWKNPFDDEAEGGGEIASSAVAIIVYRRIEERRRRRRSRRSMMTDYRGVASETCIIVGGCRLGARCSTIDHVHQDVNISPGIKAWVGKRWR